MDRRLYLKHFAILMSGTGVAQLVTFASYPALARLYTPFDFGVFALFTTVVTIVGVVACGRFDIILPVAPHAARFAVMWLCSLLSAGIGLLAAAATSAWYLLTGAEMIAALPLFVGIGIFLTGFTSAATVFLLRYDHYNSVSRSLVVRTAGVAAVQIGLAFVYGGGFGLIAGYCAGLMLQAGIMGMLLWRAGWRVRPRLVQLATVFHRFRRQAAIDVPSSLLSTMSANVLNATLLFLYDETVVGYYALANRLIVVPLKTVNDALSRVFFQKAAKAQERTGRFWREMKFNLLLSAGLSAGVLIGIWIFAPPFIPLYLGETWQPSAEMLVIMAPMLTVRSIATSIGTAVFVLRRAQWRLVHNATYLALHGAAFAAAAGMELDLYVYFILFSVLLGLELATWILILAIASYRHSIRPAAGARQR